MRQTVNRKTIKLLWSKELKQIEFKSLVINKSEWNNKTIHQKLKSSS